MTRSAPYLAVALAWLGLASSHVPLVAAEGSLRYIAFGDSITEGVGDSEDNNERGWPFRLEDLLQEAGCDIEVLNRGLGGEATPEGLTRIDSVLLEGGDLIIVVEGTNDISRQTISPETTRFNLREMARKANRRGFEVLHATVIPRYPDANVDADNVTNKRMNELIRDLAGDNNRDIVDNFEIFGQAPDRFRQLYANIANDPVGHPNPKGYDLMAQSFFDVLMGIDTVPPLPGIYSPLNLQRRVVAKPEIMVEIWDFGERIKRTESFLLVNGKVVEAETQQGYDWYRFLYTPKKNLKGVVSLGVRTQDRNDPPNKFDRQISTFAIRGTIYYAGDIDFSGRVDGYDVVVLALAFGSETGEVRFNERADLNGDGIVDGFDLAILASNFGMST